MSGRPFGAWHPYGQPVTLGDYLDAWVDAWLDAHAPCPEGYTVAAYRQDIEVRIRPFLGSVQLRDVDLGLLRRWAAELERAIDPKGVRPWAPSSATTRPRSGRRSSMPLSTSTGHALASSTLLLPVPSPVTRRAMNPYDAAPERPPRRRGRT